MFRNIYFVFENKIDFFPVSKLPTQMIDCVSSVKPFASFLQPTFQILHYLEDP